MSSFADTPPKAKMGGWTKFFVLYELVQTGVLGYVVVKNFGVVATAGAHHLASALTIAAKVAGEAKLAVAAAAAAIASS